MDAVVFDGCTVTNKGNFSNPKLNDPCHALHTDSRNLIVILNDQGGGCMGVSENVTATLRAQEHGHPPVVCIKTLTEMTDSG